MKKRIARLTAVTVLTALLVSLCVMASTAPKTVEAGTAPQSRAIQYPAPTASTLSDADRAKKPGLDGMVWAAENDSLILYIDETETDVAVKVKATGDIWYSNPTDAEEDPIASGFNQRQLKSQVSVRYYNENVQVSSMDNFSDCIQYGNFEIQFLEDGVTITYMLGEADAQRVLPEVISQERLDSFLAVLEEMDPSTAKRVSRNYQLLDKSSMSAEDLKENLEKYPGLDKHPIYVMRSSTKDYIKDEIAGYLAEAGYTEEDLAFDLEDNGFEAEDSSPWFNIPLTYRLIGDGLIVESDPNAITYNTDGYYLINVNLLPYFGAAGTQEQGYMFVPDGCGALIYLNNGSTYSYSAKVYGQDATMNTLNNSRSEVDPDLTVKMPVYGLAVQGQDGAADRAWYAIIEDGDAYANVTASVSGNLNSYNSVSCDFGYLDYGTSSLTGMVGSNSFQIYSQAKFSGVYRLRFTFLSGEEASYSGMANSYRAYLIENGVLGERLTGENIPFYAEYLGAIDRYASVLGVKYRSVTPVTTYEQAVEITDLLLAGGVENLNVIYSGWANGGLHGKAYTNIKDIGKLGKGGTNQKEFVRLMKEKGVDTFFTAQLQYVYKDGWFDGYSVMSHAPKYFDRSAVVVPTWEPGLGTKDKENDINLLSPAFISRAVKEIQKEIASLDGVGLGLGTVSNTLYSDQLEERYVDRQHAMLYNADAVDTLEESFGGRILGDNANSYVWGALSDMINVPMDSNRNHVVDAVVPFYEMVLHGYVEFAGDRLNMTDDYTTTLLKSVESGAGLYFQWIYGDNSVMKETDFDDLYSVNYEAWLEKALADYKTVNEVLGALQGQTVVKHEILTEDLVRVTYEKGTRILVNYGDTAAVYDGVSVEARSFAVVAA